MLINTQPSTVTLEDGSTFISAKADASIAISDSVAMRLVPLDSDGVSYPAMAASLIIPSDPSLRDVSMQKFLDAVVIATETLIRGN